MSGVIARIEACIPALRRHALGLLSNSQDADRLLRDCLVSALDRLHTFHRNGDVRAWLFAHMHAVLGRWTYRTKIPGKRVRRRSDNELATSPHVSEDEKWHGRNLLRRLESLTLEERAILLLVIIEQFSYADVARILRIPLRTVISRLDAGREQLRRAVAAEAPIAERTIS